MRILHTSDWHLGQHFLGKSREAEHQAFLDWLVDLVQAQGVDAEKSNNVNRLRA